MDISIYNGKIYVILKIAVIKKYCIFFLPMTLRILQKNKFIFLYIKQKMTVYNHLGDVFLKCSICNS